jgi:anti-anti-sigma regulatory factor
VSRAHSNHPAELGVDSIGGVLAVAVRGALVRGATDPLRTCLDRAIRGRRPVVLDLTDTTVIDGDGIDVLTAAHRRLAVRLRVVVERRASVHEALRAAGVAHVLSLHTSRAERWPPRRRAERRRVGHAVQFGCGTIRMYGRGDSQPSGYVSLASSSDTEPEMITSSPCCQLTGVETL